MDTLKKVKDSVPEIVYKMNPTKSHESPSVHQPSCPLPSLYNPVNLQTDLEDQELEISPGEQWKSMRFFQVCVHTVKLLFNSLLIKRRCLRLERFRNTSVNSFWSISDFLTH